jgi:crotonobetainyl-CoA:carnitine CoA-transferase CaiB-like acyl-CoA transferase
LRRIGHLTENGVSLHFLSEHRNKKSVTLDLRIKRHAEAFLDLVSTADVLIENFQVGTLESWGLGWDVLKERNPRLILARITGFGQQGPLSHRACIGRIANGFGGITFVTGEPDAAPSNPGNPMLADYSSGINAALGIMFALRSRDVTGHGQVIDIGMYETIFRMLDEIAPVYEATGKVRQRMGASAPHAIPHNHYPTADGRWIAIACTSDKLWSRLAVAIGHGDLVNGGPYSTFAQRQKDRIEIDRIVGDWCKRHTRDQIIAVCEACDVPCGPIYAIDEIFTDPQYAARQTLCVVKDPRHGSVTVPNVVIRLSDTPGAVDSLGSDLGADNREILVERLGMSAQEVAELT